MGFGKDYTPEELAKLEELNRIFDKLYPAGVDTKESDISVATFRSFFVDSADNTHGPGAQWCAVMKEINCEAVVRLGLNFRNTKSVVNRILKWRTAFQAAERSTGARSIGGDAGRALAQAWMRGVVQYFREKLERCFTQLNIEKTENECIAPATRTGSANRGGGRGAVLQGFPPVDGEQLVTRCISSARSIVSPQMSSSPYFIQAVCTCREMVQVLQVLQGVLYVFSTHYQASVGTPQSTQRSGSKLDFNFSDNHLVALHTPQWLFRFIFLFLGAMDLLQDQKRDTTSLSGPQLDHAIHCIASLVGDVDGKRKDGDVETTLNALVLGHVKNSCSTEFPPQKVLDIIKTARGVNDNEEEAAPTDLLTRYGALLQQVLVHYPNHMSSITKFSRRNGVEEWGVSVMLAELFCWDVETPPMPTSAKINSVTYHVPAANGPTGFAENAFVNSVVYHLAGEALRPLLSGLLSVPATTATDEKGSVAASATAAAAGGGEGGAEAAGAGSGKALQLSSEEQKLCALLLGVVAWLDSIRFPDTSRMNRWSALDIGPQVMREFNMGQWCMSHVLHSVLMDTIGVALEQIEKQAHATAEAAGQNSADIALAVPLLRYLLRVERVWNALTEHSIELEKSAFDPLHDMGVVKLPKKVATTDFSAAETSHGGGATRASYDTSILADFKYEFYDAVQECMKKKWPKVFADLLLDPLLNSVHVYLVRAESTAQRGIGARLNNPASAPDARMAGAKRPMPPPPSDPAARPARRPAEPEMVPLVSKEDLHGALRLVRCIKSRDDFADRYTAAVRERLLNRPAPDVIADAELEKNKKRCEQEAEQFLSAWINDAALFKTVRELHDTYAPQTTTCHRAGSDAAPSGQTGDGKTVELTTTFLDWRVWDDGATPASADAAGGAAGSPAALPTTAAELQTMAAQTASATAPLPFPSDTLSFLENMENGYNKDHSARTLRWDWHNHAFTTFTLLYPKEKGRVTTVNGTLLLQRLFLAIAAYGRAGVDFETLVKRAGMNEKHVTAVLRPCLDRDRLLVRVGDASGAGGAGMQQPVIPPTTQLALNYDYTRPPNRPRGEYTYWPNLERRRLATHGADKSAIVGKRREIIKTSIIQVMKQVKRIHHDELFAKVSEKNAKLFEVTLRNFKQEIEALIDKDFLARDEKKPNEYVFHA